MCIVISFQSQYTDGNGDFLSDAKDWAGELISGQTGTGRILVREKKRPNMKFHSNVLFWIKVASVWEIFDF